MSTPEALEVAHKAFIAQVMTDTFGISADDYTAERNTLATNNSVYIIQFLQPTQNELPSKFSPPKSFTFPIPAATSGLVMRIPKPDNNMEDSVRIRNEVAFLALARNALADVNPLLIPRVFSWDDSVLPDAKATEASVFSYILEEFKNGETMNQEDLKALSEDVHASICKQFARIVKALQSYKLPVGIKGYGSLTFDDAGNLSSTKGVFCTGGPFDTYREYLKATLEWQLAHSDPVDPLNGWKNVPDSPDLRKRIDAFVAGGLDEILAKIPEERPTLVHGDLTLPNILFNRSTNELVAIIDFDFGHIGSPITEFLYSFPEFQGLLNGVADPEDGQRDNLLNGFSGTIEPKHNIGKLWEQALAAEGVQRPSTIEAADHISNVWWFAQDLLPFHWLLPRFIEKASAEIKKKSLDNSITRIDAYLTHWGY